MSLSSVSNVKSEQLVEQGFCAELRGLTLFDVVQLECTRGERRRRVLRISSGARAGYVFIDGSQIAHATTEWQIGEAAMLEILSWSSGALHEVEHPWPERPSVIVSWQGLLLRAVQQRDEAARRRDDAGGAFDRDGASSVRRLPRQPHSEGFVDVVALDIADVER